MNLSEAMEQAKNGQVIERKYTIRNGMEFTKWGIVQITEHGTFLTAGETGTWGPLKLDDLQATNWQFADGGMK